MARCVPLDTSADRLMCPAGHLPWIGTVFPAKVETTHDLEEAGVIGQPQLLRRASDLPAVPLESSGHDLSLRLLPEALECLSRGDLPRPALLLNVQRYMLGPEDLAIGRDHHSLQGISQLPHIVPGPVVTHQEIGRAHV